MSTRFTPRRLLLIVVRAAFGPDQEFSVGDARAAARDAGLALSAGAIKQMLEEVADDSSFVEARDDAGQIFACPAPPPPRSLWVEAPASDGTSVAFVAVRELRRLLEFRVDGAVRFE